MLGVSGSEELPLLRNAPAKDAGSNHVPLHFVPTLTLTSCLAKILKKLKENQLLA
jgi:hypothetical protein